MTPFTLALLLFLCAAGVAVGWGLWRAGAWGRAALAALVVATGWIGVGAVYPGQEAYRHLFERESGLPFPEGEMVEQGGTYPDLGGEFCAAAVVAITEATAERLRRRLRDRPQDPRHGDCAGVDIGARGPYRSTAYASKDGRWLWWGVADDGRTFAFVFVRI